MLFLFDSMATTKSDIAMEDTKTSVGSSSTASSTDMTMVTGTQTPVTRNRYPPFTEAQQQYLTQLQYNMTVVLAMTTKPSETDARILINNYPITSAAIALLKRELNLPLTVEGNRVYVTFPAGTEAVRENSFLLDYFELFRSRSKRPSDRVSYGSVSTPMIPESIDLSDSDSTDTRRYLGRGLFFKLPGHACAVDDFGKRDLKRS